jgi:hypothetical protein
MFSPELGSGILSNRVDYCRITDPVTGRKAKGTPGMSMAEYYQSVIQGVWVNTKKKPLDVKELASLGVDTAPRLKVIKVTEPAKRSAGIKVEAAADIVSNLKTSGVF